MGAGRAIAKDFTLLNTPFVISLPTTSFPTLYT